MKLKRKPVVMEVIGNLRHQMGWHGMMKFVTIEMLQPVSCQTELKVHMKNRSVMGSIREYFISEDLL